MFVDIDDEEIVRKTLRKYHNDRLRLNAEDAASLKSFAGLSDNAYIKFGRGLFYFTGLRVLAPINDVSRLRKRRKDQDYSSMSRSLVDMIRQTKKGGTTLSRKIKVGVITIRPKECVLNSAGELLKHDAMVPSADRFRCPGIKPSNIKDVILFKFSGDKGGGSFKLLINPVNVKHPQSLRHVQPVCEFTAPDTRSNLRAAFFHDVNPCKEDMEDVLHRRCVLLHIKFGGQSEVAIVKNSDPRHHRYKPDPLPKEYLVEWYLPTLGGARLATKLDDRVAEVDFKAVKSNVLMVNRVRNKLDKMEFRDETNKCLASLTFKKPIAWKVSEKNQMVLDQYLLAGLFTGDLDFLSNIFGHQGASAKWLCLWCLANQDLLEETFKLEGKAPRFQKRKGLNSLQCSFEKYQKNYLDLDLTFRTKAKKAQVTQELSYSVVGQALADIPIDVVTLATMHVILGFTKKIYEWILKLYAQLVQLEEGKTAGNTTHQFRQAIVEARDNAIEYCEYLKKEYGSVVDSVEGKRVENMNVMKEIEKIENKISKAKYGKKQHSLIFQLRTLRGECEKNKTTPEEERLYEEFV